MDTETISAPALAGADLAWTHRVIERCETLYVGEGGLLVTELDRDGRIVDPEPLLADFGDVLPFLQRFGRHAFIEQQLASASAHIQDGLYAGEGGIRLFSNHDWLLGLLEIYRATGATSALDQAVMGARTIIGRMFVNDLLIDETPRFMDPRSWVGRASPFNGGYIELWLELADVTGDASFLRAAERLASAWANAAGFRRHGVFPRVFSARSRLLNVLLASAATQRVLLFKDNTNLVWSILSLRQATGAEVWLQVLLRWLDGFERHFLNDGEVPLWLDMSLRGRQHSIKAAFPVIDLFCDLALAEGLSRPVELARTVADRWLGEQWPNGLFPEEIGADRDHLDANVDMAIALLKLAGVTGDARYEEAARRAAEAVIGLHETETGFVLSVGRDGHVRSGRIIVKYQGLALKLALAPRSAAGLMNNPDLLLLLRDR